MTIVKVNGRSVQFDSDGDMPLLWYLRETLDLPGTKFGCGIGECGACTVHIDGVAVRSCSVPMSTISDDVQITTIEGLGTDDDLHPVQEAWIKLDVPQCGYCQAGQIMAVSEFLKNYPNPTDQDIDDNLTNICRCGTYTRIRKAIHEAAEMLQKSGEPS